MRFMRCFFALLFVLASSSISAPLHAQNYPSQTIRFISPSAPGGLGDIITRIVATHLSEDGAQAIVDIRSGGGTTIAATTAATADPDGYTFLIASPAPVIVAPLMGEVSYNPETDFVPVIAFGTATTYLIVNPDLPVTTVSELIEYSKANPGVVSYASSGKGSSSHLAAELFKQLTGADITHVPFRGGGPAIQALVAGQVHVMFDLIPLTIAQVRAGTVKPLAVASSQRFAHLPDVPTFQEAGIKGLQGGSWFGIVAPAGTPGPAIEWLNRRVREIFSKPDVRQSLTDAGWDISAGSPEDFGRLISDERGRLTEVVKRIASQ